MPCVRIFLCRKKRLELGGDLVEKFRNFQRHMKLKKLALTVVAYQVSMFIDKTLSLLNSLLSPSFFQMTEKDIGKLHDIFSALDKDGDGVLSVAVRLAFDAVNFLTKNFFLQEVSAGLAHMNVKYGDEILDILDELDTDGNGTIGMKKVAFMLFEICRCSFFSL